MHQGMLIGCFRLVAKMHWINKKELAVK